MQDRTLLALVATILLVPLARAQPQRLPRNIAVDAAVHRDAKVSPDGSFAAYLLPTKLGVVPIVGGTATAPAGNVVATSLLWSPDSATIYYTAGTGVFSVPRAGGTPVQLAQHATSSSVLLWSITPSGSLLFGTRFDPAQRRYYLFDVSSSGSRAPRDLINTQDIVANVQVDPSGAFLLFSTQGTQPFDPITLWRTAIDGTNPIDLAGGPIGTFLSNPRWLDNGDNAVFGGLDAGSSLQILHVSRATQSVVPLTSFSPHQRTSVSRNGDWIVFEAVDGVGGNGPAIMPTAGGGLVYLYTGQPYTYTGGTSISDDGSTVVISAARQGMTENARVFRYDLDGEMRVHPRAVLGGPLHFDLPAAGNEVGVIFLGNRGTSFPLPPVQFDFQLDVSFAILAIAQGGATPIRATLPLPLVPGLRGLRVYYQGMRWDPALQQGEFTRYGVFTIF